MKVCSYGTLATSVLQRARIALGQAITPTAEGRSVFYSFAFQILDISNSTNGGLIAALNNSIGSQTGNPSVAPAGVFVRKGPTENKFQVGIGKTSTAPTAPIAQSEAAAAASRCTANRSPEPLIPSRYRPQALPLKRSCRSARARTHSGIEVRIAADFRSGGSCLFDVRHCLRRVRRRW